MKPKDYKYTGKRPLVIAEAENGASDKVKEMKDELIQRTEENLEHVARLQDRLYADGREGLVIVLQGMDAAGKDCAIKHVMSGLNPQGARVYSFKAPAGTELKHDYLWRVAARLPERGKIAVFNRSHYEDVLSASVLEEPLGLPERCLAGDIVRDRLNQIRGFEDYLYDNGIRMVKLFLNVSRREQKRRLLERLDNLNWKFSEDSLSARARWDLYQKAYERAVNATATRRCPWYVLPADDQWFMRYLVSEAVLEALQNIDPRYPEPAAGDAGKLIEYRRRLLQESE